VKDCPYERPGFATAQELLAYAEFAEKGMLPEPGGLADQVPSFLAAVRYIWSEQRQWKAKLKIGQAGGCPLMGG